MTTGQRLERDLPMILDELAVSPYPDYIDSVLTTTARRRQRPKWTFPGRWIPMTTLTSRAATRPANPLRAAAVLALLLVALAVGAALIIGSRTPGAAAIRPAANGLVAYAAAGDIFTVDPVTGVSKAIITGPETDINPRWSRDGTHIAFERKAVGDSGPGLVYVARADGSDVVRLDTAAPVAGIDYYYFSPDGTQLLISYEGGLDAGHGFPSVLIAATDGSAFRDSALTMAGRLMPPGGRRMAPRSCSWASTTRRRRPVVVRSKAINAKTGDIRTILGVEPGRFRGPRPVVAGRVDDLVRRMGRRGRRQRRADRPDPHRRAPTDRGAHPRTALPAPTGRRPRAGRTTAPGCSSFVAIAAPTDGGRGRSPSPSMATTPASRSIGPATDDLGTTRPIGMGVGAGRFVDPGERRSTRTTTTLAAGRCWTRLPAPIEHCPGPATACPRGSASLPEPRRRRAGRSRRTARLRCCVEVQAATATSLPMTTGRVSTGRPSRPRVAARTIAPRTAKPA